MQQQKSITQGAPEGDALIHSLAGDFNNPGWCLGETPYLPMIDRQKLLAIQLGKSSIQPQPKAAWTSFSLREYMGLSTKGKTLAINTEEHDIYFELVSSLDLLPNESEEREDWFKRLVQFEAENSVKIDDMVRTIQEMRRREQQDMELAKAGIANREGDLVASVKPVFVLGTRITSDYLEKSDVGIAEILAVNGITEPSDVS